MPGLAASPKIFEYIQLPKEKYELHLLEWLIPDDSNESLEDYTLRLSQHINHENPVLIGVSFGGIIVQELCKIIPARKVILISSVKKESEIPRRLKLIQKSKIYKLFPSKSISSIDDFSKFAINKSLQHKAQVYNKYLAVRNEVYLNWAIYNVLNWKSDKKDIDIVHIHGDNDHIFPIKHIENCIKIEGGTHAMILTKAPQINTLLQEII
jgi:pimeloyl-ACP methyl ester carboxylesterase